jgi:hypothetical protein
MFFEAFWRSGAARRSLPPERSLAMRKRNDSKDGAGNNTTPAW